MQKTEIHKMSPNKNKNTIPKLELLGIGSLKNRQLKANLEEAIKSLSMDVQVEEISDINRLLQFDISGIPALVVNGRVVSQKVVPDVEDLKLVLGILLSDSSLVFPLKHFLVPRDLSDSAKNAAFFASEMGHDLKARIELLEVVEPLEDTEQVPLNKVVAGQIVDEIVRRSQKTDLDLVIMGMDEENRPRKPWFGDMISEVARKAYCPVLLIPPKAVFSGFNNIVYASDYLPEEEKVLPQVVDFARRFGATLHFVHVLENKLNGYLVDSTGSGKIFQVGEAPMRISSVECRDILLGLNRFARDKNADLMVMSTIRRSFIETLFHKSMTRKMIFNTRIPLMILHLD